MSYLTTKPGVYLSKTYYYGSVGVFIVRCLCIVVVLLVSVGGIYYDDDDGDSSCSEVSGITGISGGFEYCGLSNVTKESDLDWNNPSQIVAFLRTHGFEFIGSTDINITPYTPAQSNKPIPTPLCGPSEPLANIPSYIITCSGDEVIFRLLVYQELSEIWLGLAVLRKIAAIRVDSVYIDCNWNLSNRYWESLQIASRVVNMFDCDKIYMVLSSNRITGPGRGPLNFTEWHQEAWNALEHASSQADRSPHFLLELARWLPGFTYTKFLILRPIDSILVVGSAVTSFSNTAYLPFADKYTIVFQHLPRTAIIDFKTLQASPSQCTCITICGQPGRSLEITGLTKAVGKRQSITLDGSWMAYCMLIKNPNTNIHVHTLLGINVVPDATRMLQDVQRYPKHSDPRIFATNATAKISTKTECNSHDYYSKLYTPKILAKYGFSIGKVELVYEENRSDLYQTLDLFTKLGAISKVPEDVCQKKVICCGNALSNPEWILEEPVKAWPTPKEFESQIAEYKSTVGLSFCQNIHYRCIEITGEYIPRSGVAYNYNCIMFLELFQNINVDELRIADIYDTTYNMSTNFVIDVLRLQVRKSTKYNLHVKTLVLDNVDVFFIYWFFGRYDFTCPAEVYLVNQRFVDFAIVQILALPSARNITALIINDFLDLYEIKRFFKDEKSENNEEGEEIDSFSLFDYVQNNNKHDNLDKALVASGYISSFDDKPVESLNLDKLYLQLETFDFDLYSEVLSKLKNLGILPLSISFDDYIAADPIWLNTNPCLTKKGLTLYNTTLAALEADFANWQAQSATNPRTSPIQPLPDSPNQRQPTENLFLCFCNNQPLTEAGLATVFRWVGCHFKTIRSVQLVNVDLSASERQKLASRDYFVMDLELLTSIQIHDANPNNPPIKLPIRLYRHNFLANISSTTLQFISVPTSMLTRLAAQPEQLKHLIPSHFGHKPSLEMVLDHLQNTIPWSTCSQCLRTLYIPTAAVEEIDSDSEDEINDLLPLNFAVLSFFTCGHSVCEICLTKNYRQEYTMCLKCGQSNICTGTHRLLSLPLSNFVLVKDSINSHPKDLEWLKPLALNDKQVYFHISHQYIPDLLGSVIKDIACADSHFIHVI
ncbi:hypothetical protein NEHOM01_0823 [Nematocida homosporus]|uniref:uncharacterized protein n=1 Tax=Nematocida homosporus TaxID=1912981 RepID=UPI0022211D11|nr:uncharacterized protein NEHOM01_0823 [Nematocida homosporus]KAI5185408.1 hypothetical protein NEHOM01_0823 [Nematocida homosporus]